MNKSVDYETDFYEWALYNAQLLREGRFSEVDIEHLIEELEDMGNNKQELASRFVVLIGHLLKWEHQPEQRSSSWRGSIDEQRIQINRLIRKKPSLKSGLLDAVNDAYFDAVKIATKETGLTQTRLPQQNPYTLEQLLDESFYPKG